jgi:hypothetical protein
VQTIGPNRGSVSKLVQRDRRGNEYVKGGFGSDLKISGGEVIIPDASPVSNQRIKTMNTNSDVDQSDDLKKFKNGEST